MLIHCVADTPNSSPYHNNRRSVYSQGKIMILLTAFHVFRKSKERHFSASQFCLFAQAGRCLSRSSACLLCIKTVRVFLAYFELQGTNLSNGHRLTAEAITEVVTTVAGLIVMRKITGLLVIIREIVRLPIHMLVVADGGLLLEISRTPRSMDL